MISNNSGIGSRVRMVMDCSAGAAALGSKEEAASDFRPTRRTSMISHFWCHRNSTGETGNRGGAKLIGLMRDKYTSYRRRFLCVGLLLVLMLHLA